MKLKYWMIKDISDSAYRHGQAYANCNIYRSAGKYAYKCPSHAGLPDWVLGLDFETHMFLEVLYKHSFRQGLKGQDVIITNFHTKWIASRKVA